jgi:hypothetical protein
MSISKKKPIIGTMKIRMKIKILPALDSRSPAAFLPFTADRVEGDLINEKNKSPYHRYIASMCDVKDEGK